MFLIGQPVYRERLNSFWTACIILIEQPVSRDNVILIGHPIYRESLDMILIGHGQPVSKRLNVVLFGHPAIEKGLI